MQDVFIEYMVKAQRTLKTALLKVLILLGGAILAIVLMSLSGFLGAFSVLGVAAAVGSAYGAYFLFTSMNVEYEYAITNGEMDVDKIVAQRKRKRLCTVRWREVETFGKYVPSEHADKRYENKIMACDSPNNPELWYCTVRVPNKGMVFLVFNASEKMLEAIKKFLPKPILHAVFSNRG